MDPKRLDDLRISRRQVLLGGALGGTSLVLWACGARPASPSAGTVAPPASLGPAASGAASIAPSAGAKAGGVAKIGLFGDIAPESLFAIGGGNDSFGRLIWNTLTELDHKTLEPKPALAEEWVVSPDGTSITMQLRKDVTFHSGRPFGPDDVIAAIKNFQNEEYGSQFSSTAAVVTDMTASGPNEVKLRLANAVSNFFDMLELMLIFDKDTIDDMLKGEKFVGTGPFKFGSWNPGESLKLDRNPNYWKPDRPYLDGLELRIIPEPPALAAALDTNAIQFTNGLDDTTIIALRKDGRFEVVDSDVRNTNTYVGCNLAVKPFDNKLVRQAVAHCVDRGRIRSQVYRGNWDEVTLPWPLGSPADDPEIGASLTYDIDKAKALLQQSGVEAGAEWELGVPADQQFQQVGQILQADIEKLGVKVKIYTFAPGGEFFERLRAGTLPGIWASAHSFSGLHPATLLVNAFPFRPGKNASNFSDPAYTELVTKIVQTSPADTATLDSLYQEFNAYLLDQAWITEMTIGGGTFVSSTLRGYRANMFEYLDFDDAYLS